METLRGRILELCPRRDAAPGPERALPRPRYVRAAEGPVPGSIRAAASPRTPADPPSRAGAADQDRSAVRSITYGRGPGHLLLRRLVRHVPALHPHPARPGLVPPPRV